MSNLRLTLRGLARTPLFTIVAIFSLALGIGANTAIFSLLDQILLRTLPVKNAHELVFLYHPGPLQGSVSTDERGDPSFSYPMFRELQQQQTPFTGLAGSRSQGVSIAYNNLAAYGSAQLVSGNYFDLLGVNRALGRLFNDDDDRIPGGHPLVVLSHRYWTSRFGGDIAMLNRTMIVNGYPMTIVGVAQKGFDSERLGDAPDIFAPISMKKELTPDFENLNDRKNAWVTLMGRLRPGISLVQAETAINIPYRSQLEQDEKLFIRPDPNFVKRFRAKKIVLKPGERGRGTLREFGRQPILLLMAMTALVLLISCANVANLLLARAAARTREIAVRLAIGASRGQLIRQLLGESCTIAVAGGIVGLLAAYWIIHGVRASLPGWIGTTGFLSATLDARVLVFALALSLLTGIVFGLFPALQSTRTDLASALKDQAGQSRGTGAANRFRKSLVTVQVAVSLLLLISAGLFAKTLVNLMRVELGIRTDHLITFAAMPKLNRYTDERVVLFNGQLVERLSGIPGVQLVTLARVPAIAGSNSGTNISVEGFVPQGDSATNCNVNEIGPDYFRTMGIPLITGREFTRADILTAPKVAIVNEAFVRHFMPNQNPIGRRMSRNTGSNVKFDIEIVGLVKDAKYSSMREAQQRRVFYTPYQQNRRQNAMHFYLRTGIDPDQIAPAIRRELAALDPNLPIREIKTMEKQIEENLFAERLFSTLTGSFAGLATLLAAIGLYGVLAYNVARRTREIGIRMALGAESGHVRGLVVREVGLMLAIGAVIGLASAAAAGRLIESALYGLKSWDLVIYASATGLLTFIGVLAAYIPARRATNVDPTVALRYE